MKRDALTTSFPPRATKSRQSESASGVAGSARALAAPAPATPASEGLGRGLPAARRRPPHGFTLIEMLVVMGIIALVVGVSFPFLANMQEGVGRNAGVNSISVSVATARLMASADHPDVLVGVNSGTLAHWRGTAALVTPTDIRIVTNDLGAKDTAGNFLKDPASYDPPLNGYRDEPDRDPVEMPDQAGILGIARVSSGADGLRLVPPPFALRFDETGRLISGGTGASSVIPRDVIYDGDYSGQYAVDNDRQAASYTVPPAPATLWNSTYERYEVRFEQIETVIGVVVYDKQAIPDEQLATNGSGYITPSTMTASSNRNLFDRIMESGKTIFFSRYTGTPLRHVETQ